MQAWFDLALGSITLSMLMKLYVGCLNIWKSYPMGGTLFLEKNSWFQQTMRLIHMLIYIPLNFFGTKLFTGTDGGILVSERTAPLVFTDKQQTWE